MVERDDVEWCEVHQRHHRRRDRPCVPSPTVDHQVAPPVGRKGVSQPDEVLDQVEAALIEKAARYAGEVDRLLDGGLVPVMTLLRLWGDGTVRAARSDTTGGQPMWCDAHDRDLAICHASAGRDDPVCEGSPYHPGADPTGEAAVVRYDVAATQARAARVRLLKALEARARADATIRAVARDFRPRAGVASSEPHEISCPSCMRIGKWSPSRRKPDGTKSYKGGECRWCGPILTTHGAWPPVDLVDAHHSGQRISTKDVDAAFAAIKAAKRRARRR